MSIIGLVVILLLLGLLLWGAQKILAVIPVAEPFKTIIYVVLVIAFVLLALQYLGLIGSSPFHVRL